MTIFDKVLINLHKGYERLKEIAAVFSERVKSELNIIRMRIRMDSVQKSIDAAYRDIGRRVVDLRAKAALSKAEEHLLNDEEIVAAFAELVRRKKELEDLNAELKREQTDFATVTKKPEDTVV
jgi:hypothetical protein